MIISIRSLIFLLGLLVGCVMTMSPYNARLSNKIRHDTQTNEDILLYSLIKSSHRVQWPADTLHSLHGVSNMLRYSVLEKSREVSRTVWNVLAVDCTVNAFYSVINSGDDYGVEKDTVKTTESILSDYDYFKVSRELHLNLEIILQLPDIQYKQCIKSLFIVEKNVVVDNIWFHMTDPIFFSTVHDHGQFSLIRLRKLSEFWRRTGKHFFVFSFSMNIWKFELSNPDFINTWRSHPTTHLAGPIFTFLKVIKYVTNPADSPNINWAAIAIPPNSISQLPLEIEHLLGVGLIWALPYSRWPYIYKYDDQLIRFLMPISATPNDARHNLLSYMDANGNFVLTVGSHHLEVLKPKLRRVLREIFEYRDMESFALSVPRGVFGSEVVTIGGVEFTVPAREFLYDLMKNVLVSDELGHLMDKAFVEINTDIIIEFDFETKKYRGDIVENIIGNHIHSTYDHAFFIRFIQSRN